MNLDLQIYTLYAGSDSVIEAITDAQQDKQQIKRQIKKQLRKDLLTKRCQIPNEIWQQKSLEICDRLSNWQTFQQAQNILAFTSFRQEPDLSTLWQRFPKKNWGFARCIEKDLIWHQVAIADFSSQMQLGAFNILEPHPDLPLMDLANIDLILIPAVACDRQGYRLGYGGGFYDRWLPNSTGLKAGIIFDEFYVDELPHDAWDVPLDAILTDSQALMLGLLKRSTG
ncbi:5-formyltetrahydrofolate cyclo-ligase [Pseudanabaena sp. ABRG5-3]|uniref:5-formyltetrahydrofolate cyclo-ligase n=1 Tax=Pseudanabaena sp. ABRG5-3 TaxID=685565 RepID=UPI000DC6F0B6|nr:5-formyltetrahydrofolate cyclo-ligase [Pseudanabaena sp. ABRG5-3]BBC25876.1 5-formyltetrahydrofolate cyclo-ligase [Pseudanabaena sp. ABRG5-3]